MGELERSVLSSEGLLGIWMSVSSRRGGGGFRRLGPGWRE